MTTIVTSGSKVTVFAPCTVLQKIARILHVPIYVGNEYVGTSVSIPAKKLPIVKKVIEEKS